MLLPPEPASPRAPQLIREYDSETEYTRHASQLATEGWRPISVQQQPRGPLDRTLSALTLPFLFHRQPVSHRLVVVYAAV